MTIAEATKVLRVISIAYPNFRPQYDMEQMKDVVDLWETMFRNVPHELVMLAVRQYINGTNEFPPSIGQIKNIISEITGTGFPSTSEAWAMVRKAMSKGIYASQEEFEKLPRVVQEAIGSPEYLQSVSLEDNANMGVYESLFAKKYEMALTRAEHVKDVPQNVLDYIAARNDVAQIENKQEKDSQERRERYSNLVQKAMDNYKRSIPEEEEEEPEPVRDSRLDELRKRWGMNA